MSRPDPARIARNAAVIFDGAGEAATLRAYVSASAAQPKFGVGVAYTYVNIPITGLFHRIEPRETDMPGGQTQAAQLGITTDRAVGARDEVLWLGTAYRLDGNPTPITLAGRSLWRSPLKMAGATG